MANGLSLNRDASLLQAARPIVIIVSVTARRHSRERNSSTPQDIVAHLIRDTRVK